MPCMDRTCLKIASGCKRGPRKAAGFLGQKRPASRHTSSSRGKPSSTRRCSCPEKYTAALWEPLCASGRFPLSSRFRVKSAATKTGSGKKEKALFACLAVVFLLVCRAAYAVQPGQAAPPFTLDDTRGRPVSISALRGKVIVLNFFSVWCPPCESEMDSLNRLYGKYRASGEVVVLGVTNNTPEDVKAYEARRPIDYPVLIDSRSTAQILYDVLPIPTTFLIDKNGIIARKFFGPPAASTLEKAVKRLLDQ